MFSNLSVSYADSSLYQREPVLLFVEVMICSRKLFFDNPPIGYADTLPCTGRASFTVCSAYYFIAENHFKQSVIFLYQVSATNKYL